MAALTNLEALKELSEVLAKCMVYLKDPDLHFVDVELTRRELNMIVQTEGVADLLCKSILELKPDSEAARRLVVVQLVTMGLASEAESIQQGAAPREVGLGDETELDHLAEATRASFQHVTKRK